MSAGPSGSTIADAVRLAARAPSLHNSQPWRWQSDGEVLRLFAVPERMLTTTDPGGRQMLISCGATLDHLRAAMAAAGWRLPVGGCRWLDSPTPTTRPTSRTSHSLVRPS